MVTWYLVEMAHFYDNEIMYAVSLDMVTGIWRPIALERPWVNSLTSDGFSDLLDEIVSFIKENEQLDSLQCDIVLWGLYA